MSKYDTRHPLDLNAPQPGSKEYEENFSRWYDETYGYGLAHSRLAPIVFILFAAVAIAPYLFLTVNGVWGLCEGAKTGKDATPYKWLMRHSGAGEGK